MSENLFMDSDFCILDYQCPSHCSNSKRKPKNGPIVFSLEDIFSDLLTSDVDNQNHVDLSSSICDKNDISSVSAKDLANTNNVSIPEKSTKILPSIDANFENSILQYFNDSISSLKMQFINEIHNQMEKVLPIDHFYDTFFSEIGDEINAFLDEKSQSLSLNMNTLIEELDLTIDDQFSNMIKLMERKNLSNASHNEKPIENITEISQEIEVSLNRELIQLYNFFESFSIPKTNEPSDELLKQTKKKIKSLSLNQQIIEYQQSIIHERVSSLSKKKDDLDFFYTDNDISGISSISEDLNNLIGEINSNAPTDLGLILESTREFLLLNQTFHNQCYSILESIPYSMKRSRKTNSNSVKNSTVALVKERLSLLINQSK